MLILSGLIITNLTKWANNEVCVKLNMRIRVFNISNFRSKASSTILYLVAVQLGVVYIWIIEWILMGNIQIF